jgi:hypothetical protein
MQHLMIIINRQQQGSTGSSKSIEQVDTLLEHLLAIFRCVTAAV